MGTLPICLGVPSSWSPKDLTIFRKLEKKSVFVLGCARSLLLYRLVDVAGG